MGLKKSDQRREQPGLACSSPQLLCPDSGQVQEPHRAPFVGKRGRKGCERERLGIVWRLEPHRLRLFRSC